MRLAIALLLVASAGFAAEEKPQAAPAPSNTHLAAAVRLYQKLDLDAALAELKEAEVAAKDNEDDTVQVFVYRGLIFSDTGKTSEATDMFKRALAIRPWAEVPPDTSPRIAKTFSDARKSLWGTASNFKPPKKKAAAAAAAPAPAAAPETKPAPAPEAKPSPPPESGTPK